MPNVTVGTTSNPVSYQISTPRISARCNNSYFSTARASEVDQNNTLIKIRYDIYQGNVGSCDASKSWLDAINLYNSLN